MKKFLRCYWCLGLFVVFVIGIGIVFSACKNRPILGFGHSLDMHGRHDDIKKEGERRIKEESEERKRQAEERTRKEERKRDEEREKRREEEKSRRQEEERRDRSEKAREQQASLSRILNK